MTLSNTMNDPELPPPPNPDTGQPAPPAAPPYRGVGKSADVDDGPGEPMLAPPKGHGPVLAWHNPTWWKDGFRPALTYIFIILVVFLTLKDRGIGWMTTYRWWLFLVGVSLLSVPYFRGQPFAAGAAWFRNGKKWVNTYELISVRVASYYGFYSLKLEDADGHRISIHTGTIQHNRRLWDLVYNGIVHSTHNGRLALDRLTRVSLELPVLHTDPEERTTAGSGRQYGVGGDGHPQPPPAAEMTANPRWGSTVWSLLPLFSLGLLTPLVVGHAAWRLHSRRLAMGAFAYALPIPTFLVAAAFVPTSDSAVEWATAGVLGGLIIAWLPGGLHAYRSRWRIFARPRAEMAREQILARRTAASPSDRHVGGGRTQT